MYVCMYVCVCTYGLPPQHMVDEVVHKFLVNLEELVYQPNIYVILYDPGPLSLLCSNSSIHHNQQVLFILAHSSSDDSMVCDGVIQGRRYAIVWDHLDLQGGLDLLLDLHSPTPINTNQQSNMT
jgi:hypothetical protein